MLSSARTLTAFGSWAVAQRRGVKLSEKFLASPIPVSRWQSAMFSSDAGANSVGEAFHGAKQDLATQGGAADAIYGMTLLGDPAMSLPRP